MNRIPIPLQFNCWKHHAGYIREEIKRADFNYFDSLIPNLKVIGEGLMDLYFGNFMPADICAMILSEPGLGENRFEYIQRIQADHEDFRIVEIKDGSKWVLRLGDIEQRYIHIHPARYSPFTIRVKAPTLKTAIAVSVYRKLYREEIDLDLINRIRKNVLRLSPVKDLRSVPALNKLISFFIT